MGEQIIDGTVEITNSKLVELVAEHNKLIKHQNTILSAILNELKGDKE